MGEKDFRSGRVTHPRPGGSVGRLEVEQDGAFLDAGAQLEQAVQGQSGHVGFAPPLSPLLNLLLKLYPPAGQAEDHGTEG